jgi:glycosyltransferase involved in cell wall biosynthesis
MNTRPEILISVIIPVYNGERFIIDALESVKNQTFSQWECIIVDDGSTDKTATVVEKYIATDKRYLFVSQSNKGLSAARNAGLKNAKGNFIQFLDADDVLLPLKIEKHISALGTDHYAGGVVSYTDYFAGSNEDIFTYVDNDSRVKFNTAEFLNEFIERWESSLSIPPHCFLFSASFFTEKKIQFDPEIPNHEDFDCWLNVLKLKPRVIFIDEKLCIYRITAGSMSKKIRQMGDGFLQAIDKHVQLEHEPALLKLLAVKRREVLRRYNRIDRMTLKDKILLLNHISNYYLKRVLQKIGLIST